MSLFRARVDPRDNLIATLRAELSDTREQLRQLQVQFMTERCELLDRIIALAAPLALREMRRSPAESSAPSSFTQYRRIHYPGTDTRVAPPVPSSPLSSPLPGSDGGEGAA